MKSVNSDIDRSRVYTRLRKHERSRSDLVTEIEHLKQENQSLRSSTESLSINKSRFFSPTKPCSPTKLTVTTCTI